MDLLGIVDPLHRFRSFQRLIFPFLETQQKKGADGEDSEVEENNFISQVNDSMAEYCVEIPANLKLPNAHVCLPTNEIRSRDISEAVTDGLVESMKKYNLKAEHCNVQVLVISAALKAAVTNGRFNVDLLKRYLKEKRCTAYAITGAHTSCAIKKMHESYPKNLTYMQTPIKKLFIVAPNFEGQPYV